ncbi:MAG TPA: protein translocase subunit SecF [Alphaproteobacteria bacterium]|nr:protein translocase subunit SecF [Alphaproteobacteria bacterium]
MALKLVPDNINLAFVKRRKIFFVISAVMFIAAVASTFLQGLNFGIDFKGGILIEARNKSGPADIAAMRAQLGTLGLGEVSLQTFGELTDVLIRVEKQEGGEKAQAQAIRRIKDVFSFLATAGEAEPKFARDRPMVLKGKLNRPGATIAAIEERLAKLSLGRVAVSRDAASGTVEIVIPPQYTDSDTETAAIDKQNQALTRVRDALSVVTYRRTEFVGPQVGGELIMSGIWAVVLALFGILIYVWFRFEWQFSVAAIVALTHDILLTLGFFAELELEFNLATVAAVLTIAGYSINDTVVVFDRVRENLRKYKKMPLPELMNKSINETLSRTVLTSVTTLLAVLALVILGGQVIRDFSLALVWGVIIGTYSSVCLAVPILLYFNIRRDTFAEAAREAEGKAPAE